MSSLLFESDQQRFERCFQHAQGYHHRAAVFAVQARSVSLIFNVAAIAVECYLIALCALHGNMPLNHNYRNLLMSAEEKTTFAAALRQNILALDSIFGICAIDDYHHGTPEDVDKTRILLVCDELERLIVSEQARLSTHHRETH